MTKKRKYSCRISLNHPSIRAIRSGTRSLQTFGEQSREAALEALSALEALKAKEAKEAIEAMEVLKTMEATEQTNIAKQMLADTDRFNLRTSAPAVFHLVNAARVFYPALKVRSRRVSRQTVVDYLAKFGKPFNAKSTLTQAFKFIDPNHRLGRGDPDRTPFDAATLSDAAFIANYRGDEFVGDGLALIVATAHWFTERSLSDSAEDVSESTQLKMALLVALKQHGFHGKDELDTLVKIINWKPKTKSKRKTPSVKKPEPYRPQKKK